MSRPHPALDGAAAAARAELPEADHASFDRLATALLGARGALGAALRSQLPGVEGARWLHHEGIAPTSRASALTAEQWASLHRTWSHLDRAPSASGRGGGRSGGRPTTHGHAPGAQAAPRWF
ncbi:hypothetical protein GB931_00435 [Modestobacter sp. I12A-02628]|uniref:Uncharacterized protein n=1 Tax=Goekera deserti TaxID=2497753 RepID=A0A7K3WI13_9ACTN|nr:hypothetical protein [Goekera deserti]MPQ96414.1 hypothetical protein [Goekera deserti]NDI47274.1 hypothetical protein [Goekera deserti]NEL56104.1 hypothetical protein [Goekera deserti]